MQPPAKQCGIALIAMMAILVLGIAALFVGSLNSSALQLRHELDTFHTLQRAKDAIVGDAASQPAIPSAGYLRLPDLGFKIGNIPSEGSAAPNFSGNNKDYTVIGKLPWRTLGMEPLRDGGSECLWYIVSGRFKSSPATDALNWDTQGQIDLADSNGNTISTNLAALVIAPGAILDGQSRAMSDPAYVQCGGNYDARNYLDPYNATDAISGALHYFAGSTNNRIATTGENKLLVTANTGHYNDRFIAITPDDIFHALIRRADFSAQISMLLSDPYFSSVTITGSKGTDSVNCSLLGSNNREFCRNWKEMLLLAQLPAPAPVTIDGVSSANCARILLFGGRKTPAQSRQTAADKASPANYLEGNNSSLFAAPISHAGTFTGISAFNANTPDADLLQCLQ